MAKAIAKTAASSRNRPTKADAVQEFAKIKQETEAAREAADPKLIEAEQRRSAELRAAVEQLSGDSIAQRISALGIEMSRTLVDLSEKFTREVDLLAKVREAVQLEQRELEQLHKVDIAATSLDQLVQDYARQKEQFEAEMESRRAEWEQEAKTTERERKEAEEAQRKQRQRENEEYEYKKQLDRKKANDKYEEEMRLREKANGDRQAQLERSWAQRETALKEREEELARFRREVEQFPQRLAAEKEAAAAEAVQRAVRDYEQQILVARKDAEAERKMGELQIRTLQEVINRQNEQLAALEKGVREAKQQVQEIAVKAIEGASGARALSHVNQIAMEQAKGRPQQ